MTWNLGNEDDDDQGEETSRLCPKCKKSNLRYSMEVLHGCVGSPASDTEVEHLTWCPYCGYSERESA